VTDFPSLSKTALFSLSSPLFSLPHPLGGELCPAPGQMRWLAGWQSLGSCLSACCHGDPEAMAGRSLDCLAGRPWRALMRRGQVSPQLWMALLPARAPAWRVAWEAGLSALRMTPWGAHSGVSCIWGQTACAQKPGCLTGTKKKKWIVFNLFVKKKKTL
jgi:hypothetical protein